MSIGCAAGCAGKSSFRLHRAQRTVACPVSLAIVTLTASSPHRGQTNTVGSFFLTMRITRRLLLPIGQDSTGLGVRIQYLPLVRCSLTRLLRSTHYHRLLGCDGLELK